MSETRRPPRWAWGIASLAAWALSIACMWRGQWGAAIGLIAVTEIAMAFGKATPWEQR